MFCLYITYKSVAILSGRDVQETQARRLPFARGYRVCFFVGQSRLRKPRTLGGSETVRGVCSQRPRVGQAARQQQQPVCALQTLVENPFWLSLHRARLEKSGQGPVVQMRSSLQGRLGNQHQRRSQTRFQVLRRPNRLRQLRGPQLPRIPAASIHAGIVHKNTAENDQDQQESETAQR